MNTPTYYWYVKLRASIKYECYVNKEASQRPSVLGGLLMMIASYMFVIEDDGW